MSKYKMNGCKDSVYDFILNLILTKQIACGEKIPEQKIAETLGVSRTPIREAVQRLAGVGLVNIYKNRSAEVMTFDENSLEELLTVRVTLDTLAVQLAIYNGSNKDFIQLKDYAEKCIQANDKGDLHGRLASDAEFHSFLVKIGKNVLLCDLHENVYMRSRLWMATYVHSTRDLTSGIYQHLDIVENLMKRDVKRTVKLVHEHLEQAYGVELEKMVSAICPTFND